MQKLKRLDNMLEEQFPREVKILREFYFREIENTEEVLSKEKNKEKKETTETVQA